MPAGDQPGHAIGDRTLRFTAVRAAVPGVSHKVLAQTLRALERDGLVTRRVYATVPHQLCDWSRRHLDAVLASQPGPIRS
ncbi:winged helix-turn-helix transcriptional regulator [Micromonospora maritima]|uniref:Winged helix-turn-helix transcriptional regulator n=1 Tax=Micromonospora maritima TaxID=986711 RepID=A0ABW7ZGU8_9ACTN